MEETNLRSNRWCFTVNDDPDQFRLRLEPLLESIEQLRYICGQLEVGEDTGHLHFQGYLQLKNVQRLSWLKNNIHPTAHFEIQKAKFNDEARDYTRKEETRAEGTVWLEYGNYNKGRCKGGTCGKRNDLEAFKNAILSGMNIEDLLDNGFTKELARYPKFYHMVRGIKEPEREEVTVELYFGEPGTGKTRKAREENPGIYTVPLTTGTMWFDGYDGQEVALIDDFCGKKSKVPLDYTLRLLDRYPVQIPCKGAFIWWVPKKVIITTNIHPENWYDWHTRRRQWEALKRRIHRVVIFEEDGTQVEVEDLNRDFFEDYDLCRN